MKKILANPHKIQVWMHGQNYSFDACMGYLAECLEEDKEYNYWFFSGVTGDSFMQIFNNDTSRYISCYSFDAFDYNIAKTTFDAIGYTFEYADKKAIGENPDKYIELIKAQINAGKPVITRGIEINEDFVIICGYDDENGTLFILEGENDNPKECRNDLNFSQALVFAGEKTSSPKIADVYREAVMKIPSYITKESAGSISFGKQAFIDWAESFQDGRFKDVPTEKLNNWQNHGTYLCISGTNGASRGFLKRCLELNPDMDFINTLEPIYAKHGTVFEELAYGDGKGGIDYANGGMEKGFNISVEKFKNPEIMRPISEKIMESAKYCDEILEIFENLE